MTARQGWGILEGGLIACLVAAVIAFGGTQPVVFPALAAAIFVLAAASLWLPGRLALLPWKSLGLLVLLLVLQAAALRARGEPAGAPLGEFLLYPTVFALTAAIACDPGARARLVAALIVVGTGEAFYGLAQQLAGWQQILGIEKIYYREQATGTYVNPNHFAGLLEMVLPLVLAAAAERWDRAGRSGEDGNRPAAVFFAALALVLAAGIFASHSRMGLLSTAAGVALTAGIWLTRGIGGGKRGGVLLATALAAALLAVWLGPEPVVKRFRSASEDARGRLALWQESMALVRARPLLGAGWGTYPNLYTQVQATQLENAVEHAHNDYLELATEFGTPGAALLVALVLGVALPALRYAHQGPPGGAAYQALGAAGGIAALGVHSFGDFNLRLPANALVFAALLGLAYACTGAHHPAGESGTPE
jgi:O-antigen ligase